MSSTYTPAPSFPAGIPGDGQIPLAFPDALTQLASPIDANALTMTVTSGAVFPLTGAESTIVRIEDEQIKIVARTGNTLTVQVNCRGFNGTQAAAHGTGTEVRGVVSSYGFNRMREELQAVAESAADARAYAFAYAQGTQFTGMSGTPGPQTITFLSPFACPRGVSGTNQNHWLLVRSDSASEAVLITGGSAVSGGTGTLQFTTVNSHSGVIQVTTATAGLQEAVNVSAFVRLPAGSYTMSATCSLPYKACLTGVGQGATELVPSHAALIMFTNPNKTAPAEAYKWTIADLSINARAFPVNTVRAFELVNTWQGDVPGGTPTTFYLSDNNCTFRNLTFRNVRHAFFLDRVVNVHLLNIEAIDNTGTYIGDTTDASRTYNVAVRGYIHHLQERPGPQIAPNLAAGSGLLVLSRVNDGLVDGFQTMGMSSDVDGIVLSGECAWCTICNSAARVVRNGIRLTGAAAPAVPSWTSLVNVRTNFCYAAGFEIEKALDTIISACRITQNDGGLAPNAHGIHLSAGADGVTMSANVFQRFYSAGSAIKVDDAVRNFSIANNFFRTQAPTLDINIAVADHFAITGNNWAVSSTGTKIAPAAFLCVEASIFGNVPDPGTLLTNNAILHDGSPAAATSRTWEIHTSGAAHGGNAGDYQFRFDGGGAPTYAGQMRVTGRAFDLNGVQLLFLPSSTFANLPTPPVPNVAGSFLWGIDCTVASPTTGGGTGALVVWNGTQWVGK